MKQMRVISIVWGGILVLLVVLLTLFGFKLKDKNLKYKELEKKLVTISEEYVELKTYYPQGEDKLKITWEDLVSSDIIDEDELEKNKCNDAYIMVYLKDMVYHFDAYLKCDEYTTKNYNKNS